MVCSCALKIGACVCEPIGTIFVTRGAMCVCVVCDLCGLFFSPYCVVFVSFLS